MRWLSMAGDDQRPPPALWIDRHAIANSFLRRSAPTRQGAFGPRFPSGPFAARPYRAPLDPKDRLCAVFGHPRSCSAHAAKDRSAPRGWRLTACSIPRDSCQSRYRLRAGGSYVDVPRTDFGIRSPSPQPSPRGGEGAREDQREPDRLSCLLSRGGEGAREDQREPDRLSCLLSPRGRGSCGLHGVLASATVGEGLAPSRGGRGQAPPTRKAVAHRCRSLQFL